MVYIGIVFYLLRLQKSENSAYLFALKLFDEYLHNLKIIFQKALQNYLPT